MDNLRGDIIGYKLTVNERIGLRALWQIYEATNNNIQGLNTRINRLEDAFRQSQKPPTPSPLTSQILG